LSQRVIVPSVTLSPSCGIVTGLATTSSCYGLIALVATNVGM